MAVSGGQSKSGAMKYLFCCAMAVYRRRGMYRNLTDRQVCRGSKSESGVGRGRVEDLGLRGGHDFMQQSAVA